MARGASKKVRCTDGHGPEDDPDLCLLDSDHGRLQELRTTHGLCHD